MHDLSVLLQFTTSFPPHVVVVVLKRWSLANELGLVVVALYQKSLQLQYVEELVDNIKRARICDFFVLLDLFFT